MLGSSSTKPHEIQMMKSRKNLKAAMPLVAAMGTLAFTTSAHGATILEGWTSVATLDYTNVVGAWNFVDSDSAPVDDYVVQGVTFTAVDAGNGSYGNLTVAGLLSNGASGFTAGQAITSGGTGADQTNLTAIVNSVLNGSQGGSPGSDITLNLSGLSSGTYNIQYIWAHSGATDRSFRMDAEGVQLGSINRTSSTAFNYLIAEQVSVTDGTLNINLADGGFGDERRTLSALIVNQIPEPSAALLGGLGALLLLRRRR